MQYFLWLGIALTVGIGLIGPAMAMWSDPIFLWEEVSTGDLTGKVMFKEVYLEDHTLPYDPEWGILSASIVNLMGNKDQGIRIEIDREENRTSWVLSTKMVNQGSIPVRFLRPTVVAGAEVEVAYTLPDQVMDLGRKGLDPNDSVEGQIALKLNTEMPGVYPFQVELKCIQWNAYNEDPWWWKDTLQIYGSVIVREPPAPVQAYEETEPEEVHSNPLFGEEF